MRGTQAFDALLDRAATMVAEARHRFEAADGPALLGLGAGRV